MSVESPREDRSIGHLRERLEPLLAMRLYSWAAVVLIGLTGQAIATGSVSPSRLTALVGVISLLLWIAGSGITEFFRRRYEYDESALPYLSVLVLVAVPAVIVTDTVVVGLLCLAVCSSLLYALKTTGRIGRVSFLVRGVNEVIVFVLAVVISGGDPTSTAVITFSTAIYLTTCSRNLVGDLRDRPVDEYTLPVVAPRGSQWIAVGLGLLAAGVVGDPLVVLPLLFAVGLTATVGQTHAYQVHRLYVVCTTFFVANYLLATLEVSLVVTTVLLAGVVLDRSYNHTPRKIAKQSEHSTPGD